MDKVKPVKTNHQWRTGGGGVSSHTSYTTVTFRTAGGHGRRLPTTGDEIRQPGQSQMGGCTCRIPLDIRVFRLFPGKQRER